MYFDLFLPFPVPQNLAEPTGKKGKKDKGKAKAPAPAPAPSVVEDLNVKQGVDYWSSVTQLEKEGVTRSIALAGHCSSFRQTVEEMKADAMAVGYDVVGCTISSEPSNSVVPNPFALAPPFPDLDPRSPTRSNAGRRVVQVTRFHIRLDDGKTHCFVSPSPSREAGGEPATSRRDC